MRNFIASATALAAAVAAPVAVADLALAQKSGCMACHQVEMKVVGPSYKDVAAKYKDDAGAQAMLVEKVRKGGVGNWGQVPMPPNAVVSDEDLDTLIAWVLSQ